MKRGLILIALIILSVGLFGQNKFKYEIQATGGISVGGGGGDTVKIDSVTFSEHKLKFYRGQSELSTIGTGIQIRTIASMQADTVPLFVFGAGAGITRDTACFRTSAIYGAFFNTGSDTIVVTEMRNVLQGSSPSLTVDVMWHTTLGSGSAVHLNSTPPTVTSITTGDVDTTFDNAIIPPNVWVWCRTPTITTQPTYFSNTLSGFKRNRAY